MAEGDTIIGEALEVQDEAVPTEAVAAAPAVQDDQENARAEVPAIQEQQEEIPIVQEDQAAATTDVQEIATEVNIEAPVVSSSRIADIPPEGIKPVGQIEEVITPTSRVASILRSVLDSIPSTQGEQEQLTEEVSKEAMAPGHIEDVVMVDAPIDGEHTAETATEPQGEPSPNPPVDQFQEGVLTSPSESEEEVNVENVEPFARASDRSKVVAPEIPLLTRKPHWRLRQKKLKVNMKPIIERLDEQGTIHCSVHSDIASIFISQSTTSNQIGALTSKLQSLKSELGRLQQVLQELSIFVRAHLQILAPLAPPPTEPEVVGPSGPSAVANELGPSGHNFENLVGPSGPSVVEEVVASELADAAQSGPSGPVEDISGPSGFTHFCLGSVNTRSKQVDTSPRFQKAQLPDWDSRSTLAQSRFQKGRSTLTQGRSTLDPVSSRQVCRNGTTGRHTPAESQNREFLCTRGWLGFRGFDLGFHAHAPQSTLWTYGAINTHVPCTQKAREPIHFQKKLFGGQRGLSRSVSISRSYKPSFQEERQGNQGESLERRLLCKAREQIQLKRLRRRRISGISDAIKAEYRQ
ncbi:hypothetical protein Taro_016327, partial [Colocasia esculenta]|nr:hypothetical protein [Colocasia esculenta]